MAKKKSKAQVVWNTIYDVLKWITLIFFPAVITLVSVILQANGTPNADFVITILTAVETFMGSILGISSITYHNAQNINGKEA